jgi:DNA-binding winged helix-turn-helix (wHTH) protein
MSGTVYTFGPFELDASRRRLRRGDTIISVPDRQIEILIQLVASGGAVLTKDALITAAWQDVAVTDNSLEQAISSLRKLLGPSERMGPTEPWIETVPRRGYRFVADVSRRVARETDESLEALLAPHRAWVEGRAALETLGRAQAVQARQTFAGIVAASPDYAPAHVGLANACAFAFEATRVDAAPDRAALVEALAHAREACRLDPQSAEPWATLAFVLHLTREPQHAIAAARRAISLEPDNWRHHLRLSLVSWGEERLRAAQRCLALLPGLALAHWLAATVHVARQALDHAAHELELGAGAQDAQPHQARFSAVALHWLLGLVCLARGDETRALEEFDRELSFEESGQLYARECCANTWYAIGAIAFRAGRRDDAAAAFAKTLERVPGHIMALAGLVAVGAQPPAAIDARAAQLAGAGFVAEAAIGRAAMHAIGGDPALAAQLIDGVLSQAPPGSAGWTLPVEPLLHVVSDGDLWRAVLARLRSRAA